MVGFRQARNIASVPFRSNVGGIGFRDATNYFNLSPITAGPLVTDYTDLSNYVPSYTPPPPPPTPVYDDNDGGDNVPGPGNYQDSPGSSTWSPRDDAYDDEMGDTGISLGTETSTGSNSNVWSYEDDYSDYSNGQDDNHNNDNNNFNDTNSNMAGDFSGEGAGGWWNTGGTIPPLYAYDGLTKQERDRAAILAQREAARKPKSTLEFTYPDLTQVPKNAMDIIPNTEIYQSIAGLPERFSDAGRFAVNKAEEVTRNALGVPDRKEIFGDTRNLAKDSIDRVKDYAYSKGLDPVNVVKSNFMNNINNPILSAATALGQAAATKAGFPAAAAYLVGNEIKNQIPQQEKDKLNIINPFSVMSQELYDAVYDEGNDYGYTPSQIENAKTAIEQEPSYGVNTGTVPNIDMTNPADYNIKDFVGIPEFTTSDIAQEIEDEIQNIANNKGAIYGDYSPSSSGISKTNKGAIYGNYSPPSANISLTDPNNYNMKDFEALPGAFKIPDDFSIPLGPFTISFGGSNTNDITGTPTYNDFVAKTPDEYQTIIDSLNNTINKVSGYNGVTGVADGGDGGGWADGGFYNDDGTDFGTNEYSGGQPTTGDAFTDAMEDTDQFGLSRGGHIYASKGGYVNSAGGK